MKEKLVYDRKEGEEDIYAAWLRNADERQVLERALEERLDEWCLTQSDKPFEIVDIGCGRGSAAAKLFKVLEKRGIVYQYTGVEPSQIQLDQFRSELGEDKNKRLVCSTLEEFDPTETFDLTYAVHPLYYVPDMVTALKKMLSFSRRLLIAHHGVKGINEAHQQFRQYVRKGPHIISTHEDVTRALDELGVDYMLQVYPTRTNIQSCKDPNNPEGRNMIKFFLEQPDLPESVIEEVSKYFSRTKLDYMIHDLGLIITK